MQEELLSIAEVADILSVSKDTLRKWDNNGTLVPQRQAENNYRVYRRTDLLQFEAARSLFQNTWDAEMRTQPLRPYTLVELFAGAGGLAIGMEKSGFDTLLLNELDKHACQTLRQNRPHWNVVEGSISGVGFKHLHGTVDLLTGGFPCQAFSYAGKKMGFEDTRGTLFFEFARAVKEISPKILLAENVRGLQKHDDGNTLKTIRAVIAELGYTLIEPRILKALFYQVPQKRERLILVGIRNDLAPHVSFSWPSPYKRIMTMRDAMFAGELYPSDVPDSPGQRYPLIKEAVMAQVPAGGYWRDLPVSVQRDYMKKSFFLSGGKTGMARRLSWDEPSLTLTCAPAQKQTERCHPEQTRPLTVREYARIQTFPDSWEFSGPIGAQYKQIGNAVPVNLAHAIGRALIRALNSLEKI